MVIQIVLLLCVPAVFVTADIKLDSIKTDDLMRHVEFLKKDIDQHLQLMSDKRKLEKIGQTSEEYHLSSKSSIKNDTVMHDKDWIYNYSEYSPDNSEAEIKLQPKTDDLQRVVQSVKIEIEKHLKLMSDRLKLRNESQTHSEESMVSTKPSTKKDTIMDETLPNEQAEEISVYSPDDELADSPVKGRPGVDFPDYTDIPRTSFTCSDKSKIPGFYADMDTGCQVFHACWPDRRESFLCPIGTIFNQAVLACDFWYNSNCSLAYSFYEMNSNFKPDSSKFETAPVQKTPSLKGTDSATPVTFLVSKFMPVKAKIVVYPKSVIQLQKIASASNGQYNVEETEMKTSSSNKRVPRSLVYGSSSKDLFKLKAKIHAYRLWEALNNAVKDIKSEKSLTVLFPYVERILKFVNLFFYSDKSPTMVNIKPGTELYKYNIELQKQMKWVQLIDKILVQYLARNLYDADTSENHKHKNLQENEDESLKPVLLTKLNPRFIVKPATTDINLKRQDSESEFAKARVQYARATVNPLKLSLKDPVGIYPKTKRALLKSYVKLYKAKYARL